MQHIRGSTADLNQWARRRLLVFLLTPPPKAADGLFTLGVPSQTSPQRRAALPSSEHKNGRVGTAVVHPICKSRLAPSGKLTGKLITALLLCSPPCLLILFHYGILVF